MKRTNIKEKSKRSVDRTLEFVRRVRSTDKELLDLLEAYCRIAWRRGYYSGIQAEQAKQRATAKEGR